MAADCEKDPHPEEYSDENQPASETPRRADGATIDSVTPATQTALTSAPRQDGIETDIRRAFQEKLASLESELAEVTASRQTVQEKHARRLLLRPNDAERQHLKSVDAELHGRQNRILAQIEECNEDFRHTLSWAGAHNPSTLPPKEQTPAAESKVGRPRKDAVAARAQQLHTERKAWKDIAKTVSHEFGQDYAPASLQALVRSRKKPKRLGSR